MTPASHALGALALLLAAGAAQAQVAITEVAPWSSGNSPVDADWFELTNLSGVAVDITGWRIDDSSNSLAASVALAGVSSIAPGASVVFIEGADANPSFVSTWYGAAAPAGLQIGRYAGSGIGLGTGGDALNVFDAAGLLVTRVDFGASPASAPYASFDNAAGLAGAAALTTLSVAGINGAFVAAAGNEIGSPGSVGVVPEPGTWALLMAGLALVGGVARRRAV